MNLKKSLTTLFFSFSAILSAFSQADEYAKHLENAKSYEANKQWVYALGEYYDADICYAFMPDLEESEAKISFEKLLNTISEGNPGYSNFDVFDLYDNWILLLQDYERYWTEYCPFYIETTELERGSVDTKNKTATYSFRLDYDRKRNSNKFGIKTEKFKLINSAVNKGFQKAYKEQKWDTPYSTWPSESVYNDEKNTYLKNNTVIYKDNDNDGKKYLASTSIIKYYKLEGSSTADERNQFTLKMKSGETTLYDISLNLIDSEGNVIKKFDPHLMDDYNIYEFSVSAAEMKLIDAGKTKFVLSNMELYYGDPKCELILPKDKSGKRNFLKNLSKIQIDLGKVEFYDVNDKEHKNKIEEAKKLQKEKEKKARIQANEEAKKQKQQLELDKKNAEEKAAIEREIPIFENSIADYYFDESEIVELKNSKSDNFFLYCGKPSPNEMNGQTWDCDLITLRKKFGDNKVELVYVYCVCNSISRKYKLTPYYTLNSSSTADSELKLFLENFESIQINSKTNGWHIPSENEKSIIQTERSKLDEKKGKSLKKLAGFDSYKQDLSTIPDYIINSGDFLIRNSSQK